RGGGLGVPDGAADRRERTVGSGAVGGYSTRSVRAASCLRDHDVAAAVHVESEWHGAARRRDCWRAGAAIGSNRNAVDGVRVAFCDDQAAAVARELDLSRAV